jgi:hypothetical protein
MKLKVKDIIKNKYLLYFVAIIAFFLLINLITTNKFTGILLFYVSGVLAYYFTKNMTIVLGVAIISTFFANILNGMFNLQEGFKEGLEGGGSGSKSSGGGDDEDSYDNMDGSGNFGNMKNGYQNQIPLNPSELSIPNKESVSKQLGKADKLESAYNNLEKVIGSNGIKSMSSDTEKLIAKQGELLKQLKDLTPELNKTIDSVSKLDINGILGSFKGISNSLNNI